jgi:hypothetical protein
MFKVLRTASERRLSMRLLATLIRSGIVIALALGPFAGKGMSQPKTFQPFTAKRIKVYLDETGGKLEATGSFSRTKDGSYAIIEETEAYEGERGIRHYILNTADQSWTTIDSFTKSSTFTPFLEEAEFRNLQNYPGTCQSLFDDSTAKRGEELEMHGLRTAAEINPQS